MLKLPYLMKNIKGFTLVLVIIIVLIVAIIFAGIIPLIAANLRFAGTKVWESQDIYAAQAGIMRGIYDYRRTGNYSAYSGSFSGTNINYSLGQKRYNFFLCNPSSSELQTSNTIIAKWTIKNINTTQSLTITHMRVSWVPNNPSTEKVTRVWLNGTGKWTGSLASGALINIADTSISAGTTMLNNNLRFLNNMTGKTVTATFLLSDGSTFEAQVFPPASAHLIMKATGSISVEGKARKRSIEAKYETATGKIFNWEEVYDHY